jgi:rhodanese-related sulfurtransferase
MEFTPDSSEFPGLEGGPAGRSPPVRTHMSFENVSVREAHEKQSRGYTYVDVRSIPEFEQGHPAGAVNVPLLHRDGHTGQMMPNREFLDVMRANFPSDAKLLIGCQVGGRSAHAAEALVLAGFNAVANVVGGFGGARDPMTGAVRAEGWTQAALPVETGQPAGNSYEDLHAKLAQQGPVAE